MEKRYNINIYLSIFMNKEVFGDIFSIFTWENQEDIEKVLSLLKDKTHQASHFEAVFLDGKEVKMFSRTYFLDDLPSNTQNKLSNKQKIIFNCLWTTQSDGYDREECIGNILKSNELYIPYFVLRVIWWPVTHTQELIYENIASLTNDIYKDFIINNPEFYSKIKNRVMSYWSEYRRRDTSRDNYIWFKILEKLDELIQT